MNPLVSRSVTGIAAVVGVAIGMLSTSHIHAQSANQSTSTPKWEAVSIRPTKDCGGPGGAGVEKSGPKGGGGAATSPSSPDRISMCSTAMQFIRVAYVISRSKGIQANPGLRLIPNIDIEGAPGWADSELFQITAKAEGAPGRDTMTGPMMQSLLEYRFKLKIHRDGRDRPVYALSVAKGGPKLQASVCTPPVFPPEPPAPGQNVCPDEGGERKGSLLRIHRYAKTLGEFAIMLVLDRPVVDKTGLAGVFDYHLEFTPDDAAPMFPRAVSAAP